jgi:hypothetical protein
VIRTKEEPAGRNVAIVRRPSGFTCPRANLWVTLPAAIVALASQ